RDLRRSLRARGLGVSPGGAADRRGALTGRATKEDPASQFWRQIRAAHPGFIEAVRADALITLHHRGERAFRSRADAVIQIARLACVSDGFLGQMLYRAKPRLQALGVPVLPRVAHRLAVATAQIAIGDPVVLAPGVYIAHGQVVFDGITKIGSGAIVGPFVSIGLVAGEFL